MKLKTFGQLMVVNALLIPVAAQATDLTSTLGGDEEILIEQSRQKECLKRLVSLAGSALLPGAQWLGTVSEPTPMVARAFRASHLVTHAGYSVGIDKDEFSVNMAFRF